eukprot:352621-Chlamydomonas_euryale.AAC.1
MRGAGAKRPQPLLGLAEPDGDSKCSLAALAAMLASQGVEWGPVWDRICEVVTAALFAAQASSPFMHVVVGISEVGGAGGGDE